MKKDLVIGVDYGTDSVRAIVVNAETGKMLGSGVHHYSRWAKGLYCNPSKSIFRQHPLDHIDGLEFSVKTALSASPPDTKSRIAGIGIDTTGSTPGAVDKSGTPLALLPEFSEEPDAMFVLWKDHSSVKEAAEINELAHSARFIDFTKFSGGIYSSEWFWAKILHVTRTNEKIKNSAWSWVEHCDWIPALLCGIKDVTQIKRSRCAAGHKAMWHHSWGGLPSEDFLSKLDPALAQLKSRLYTETFTADIPAGKLCKEWADKLGIEEGIFIAGGAFDAHVGAVGAFIKPYALTKVMGTSTCDILIAPEKDIGDRTVRGICGQVDGSVVPGFMGLEAGQSAFGDIYAWFRDVILSPVNKLLSKSDFPKNTDIITYLHDKMIPQLTEDAVKIPPEETACVALDWMNGRRTPDADQTLKGTISGLTLGSDAGRIFKSLVEATAYGSRKIVERFEQEGVRIDEVIAIGGISKKSDFVMQTVSDVLGRKIKVAVSDQTCALGAGIFAAVAGGIYPDVPTAQEKMNSGFEKEYHPDSDRKKIYDNLYWQYGQLGKSIEGNKRMSIGNTNSHKDLKEKVWAANQELVKHGLVRFTFGNVSGIDRLSGIMAIKPSGVSYEELTPDMIVLVDMDGKIIEGSFLRPSSDTKTHIELYKAFKNIGGISHTHSLFATAWAQALKSIPCLGTTHADLAHGSIPCTPLLDDQSIEGDYERETGLLIISTFKKKDPEETPMVLVAGHGPFTWGDSPLKAVYNSVMLEDIASMALSTLSIAPKVKGLKKTLLEKHFQRKHGKDAYYGQKPNPRPLPGTGRGEKR